MWEQNKTLYLQPYNNPYATITIMSETQLRSYRLTSMEEPTDEMLHAIMEKVAESARRSTTSANAIISQRLASIRVNN